MQRKTTALLIASAVGAGLLTWAARRRADVTQPLEKVAVMAAGRWQLGLLRQLVGVGNELLAWRAGLPRRAVGRIERHTLPTAAGPARLTFYWPAAPADEPLPVYVNFHGGGFVLGCPEQDDRICRYLAHHTPCVVVNVDYALAPEQPYPAAVLQAYEVVQWVHAQAPARGYAADRLAVGGHSAGASLAAAVAWLQRERQEFPLALQLLDYPPLDLATPSSQKNVLPQRQQVLSVRGAEFFRQRYLPRPADRLSPLASPLLAPNLAGLAPALIITAEYDLLRYDGRRYAEKLRQQGVAVAHHDFLGVDHAFTHLGPAGPALQAWQLMRTSLQKAFYPVPVPELAEETAVA